jgi:sulfatase maturation enzyme AslB (radical SAM superfamily)
MKILCLGNNTNDTDIKTCKLSAANGSVCHGLLSELDFPVPEIVESGWYHSSLYDIEYSRLIELSSSFDSVIMLDLPKDTYSHPDIFYKTVKLIKNLPNGKFLDPSYSADIDYFENLVKTNKSFCIFPFIELVTKHRADGYTTVCCRSTTPITHVSNITDWQNDKNYNIIRDKMLAGVSIPEHCSTCYKLEDKNILSARQQETVEWANRLNLHSLDDLRNITAPAYYEIRPSNVCNIQCRMCSPGSSHLIGREYKKLNLISELPPKERSNFSIVNFASLKKLYVAGGEPTAMPEFYKFLDDCIENKQTDFEFTINTNATKFSNRFKKQLKQFSHLQFIISLEGVGPLNHYIRWPSHWDPIVDNMRYLRKNNHIIATNTTVSIYNVIGLYDLLNFLDNEFPRMLRHCQLCQSDNDMLSGLGFPDSKLALDRLLPIRDLKCYKNDNLLKSFIDGLIEHYRHVKEVDVEKLKLFFEFNDKLDKSRGIKLVDYVPELEQARKLIL